MDVVEQVLAHLLQVAADPGDCAEAGVYPVDRLVQGLRGDLAIQLAQGIAMFRRPARNELDDILELALQLLNLALDALALLLRDRKSVVLGKRVSVRVDLGGRRIIKKKKNKQNK